MRIPEEELRRAVRTEAAAHRPDRAAMLDRLARTTMRTPARRTARLRIVGAAVAVAAVLGGGGIARWTLAGDGAHPLPEVTSPAPAPTAAPPPATTTPSPAASGTGAPDGRKPSRPPSRPATGTSRPATTDPADPGPLRASGVADPDPGGSQGADVVRITTTQRLAALEVTIRVARTPGLASRGGSQQVPGASVETTVTEQPDALIYRFVVSAGDRLEPGTYSFSARYTHAPGGRAAAGDSYRIAATTADGTPVADSGRFA